jgi:hypothetical protein
MTFLSDAGQAVENPAVDWISAMRAGEFERAWAITDRDLATCRQGSTGKHKGPRHLQRIWRGEELRNRRVLVRCYHGLGDTIQFARFLPPLAELAGGLSVWCQPELLPLIERVEGVDRAIPLHDGTPDIDFEVDIEIMEIPHAIRACRDLIELHRPYLTLPSSPVPRSIVRQKALAVGLVWEVGNWDKRRAIPARLLQKLNGQGIELYSLQRGAASGEADHIGARDISTPDIMELAHRISELDLVVSVDTMVVHLAGALGYEPWVMLHADCDWRWPSRGGVSLWYPRAKLFHQHRAGGWADVIDNVSSALVDRVQLGVELGRRSECVSQVTGHSLSEGRIARMSGL